MKGSKLAGVLVASAIVGLSLGDALTGHGIKGNKNLNPIVVGDGSSSSGNSGSGSGSGSSSNSGSGSNTSNTSNNKDTGYAKVVKTVIERYSKKCINGELFQPQKVKITCEGTGSLGCVPQTADEFPKVGDCKRHNKN